MLLDGKHDQRIVGERLFDLLRRNIVQRDVSGVRFIPVELAALFTYGTIVYTNLHGGKRGVETEAGP